MTTTPPRASRSLVAGIWARTPEGVIGRDGTIPWHVPEDLRFFSRMTTGHPVLMGRRTWESFPPRFRPLPGRENIVITSRSETVATDEATVHAAASYPEALALAQRYVSRSEPTIWVIGGPQLWAQALGHHAQPMTRALVTTIDLAVPGDTVAPELPAEWRRREVQGWRTSSTGVRYRIEEFTAPGA